MTVPTISPEDCQQRLGLNREYQKAVSRILHKIRNGVGLTGIFATTSQDVARLLGAERVMLYRFESDWSGHFVNEYSYAAAPWDDLPAFGENRVWEDTHLQDTQGGRYQTHDSFAVDDIHTAGHTRCHLEMLEQFQIRAYAIAPIFSGQKLWGLVAAYQHSSPRQWLDDEVNFLSQVADQLGIALQHDGQRSQTAAQSQALQTAIAQQRSLTEVVSKIGASLDTKSILRTACRELCKLLELERAAIYRFEPDWSGGFVCTYGTVSPWEGQNPFGENQVWEDTYLQETEGGRYRNHECFAVNDIYRMGHAHCHLDLLEQYKIRAYALAPIFVGDRLWGLLGAYQHSGTHDWQSYETEFLAQVAGQLGVAIHQAELLEHSKQQSLALEKAMSRQRALSDVVNRMRSSLDIEHILKTTCQEATSLLSVDRVAVYRFNQDWSGSFVSHFSRLNLDQDGKTPFGQNPTWEDTFLQETQGGRYRKNETLAVRDIYEAGYAQCHLDLLEQYQVRAYALVPIFVGQNLWGLLGAYQHSGPYDWETSEVDFLTHLANQLGMAIQSAELLGHSQSRSVTLEQSAQQRQLLFDVVAKIRQFLDLDKVFQTTVKELRRSMKADRTGIFKFHDGAKHMSGEFIAEDAGIETKAVIGVSLEEHCFGENFVEEYAKGKILSVADVATAGFQDCHLDYLAQLEVKSLLIVPLLNGDVLWGFLCVHQCDRIRHWTDSDMNFIKQVAAQLSVALGQATLHHKTQEQAKALKNSFQELQSAQLQVIQSEKMASLGQLVAGVAHEINNPVSFIHGNLTYADEYVQDLLKLVTVYQNAYPEPVASVAESLESLDTNFIQEDLPKLLQSMKMGTERIREIVKSLRNFSRLDESEAKSVNIHEGLESTLMILHNRLKPSPGRPAIHVVKDYDKLPEVECFPGQLNQVFMNLLSNAIDALEERHAKVSPATLEKTPSEIRITTARLQTDRVSIHVADNGLGIPQGMIEQVFDPFFTTKPVGQGTGLGLSISHQIVTEKHDGKLVCHSSADQGTEFVVEIPIRQSAARAD